MAPSVLFGDESTWEAFTALAGALRRRGIRTMRVTAGGGGLRERALKALDRCVYGRTHVVRGLPRGATAEGLAAAIIELLPADVVDVQAPDDVSHALVADPTAAAVMRRTAGSFPAGHLFDKADMDLLAGTLGVPVPERVANPSDADFPIVVKARRGSGGSRVRIVRDRQALAEARAELEHPAEDCPVIQRFHDGGLITVGGVAAAGQPLVLGSYRPRPSVLDPTGPSVAIEAVDRDDVLVATRALLSATGYSGIFCIDFVLDAADGAKFLDFNARAFGSWPSLQSLGVDLVGAYLHLLGLGPRPEPVPPRLGEQQLILRFPAPADSLTSLRHWVVSSLGVVSGRRDMLGWRWAGVSSLRIGVGAALAAPRAAVASAGAGRRRQDGRTRPKA